MLCIFNHETFSPSVLVFLSAMCRLTSWKDLKSLCFISFTMNGICRLAVLTSSYHCCRTWTVCTCLFLCSALPKSWSLGRKECPLYMSLWATHSTSSQLIQNDATLKFLFCPLHVSENAIICLTSPLFFPWYISKGKRQHLLNPSLCQSQVIYAWSFSLLSLHWRPGYTLKVAFCKIFHWQHLLQIKGD